MIKEQRKEKLDEVSQVMLSSVGEIICTVRLFQVEIRTRTIVYVILNSRLV